MARKCASIEQISLFHSTCAGIIGTLLYYMETFPITRYKLKNIYIYYLKSFNNEVQYGEEVSESVCLDYIQKFVLKCFDTNHLPKGYTGKTFYEDALQSYLTQKDTTLDGGETFIGFNRFCQVGDKIFLIKLGHLTSLGIYNRSAPHKPLVLDENIFNKLKFLNEFSVVNEQRVKALLPDFEDNKLVQRSIGKPYVPVPDLPDGFCRGTLKNR
jgi:hypothetical protein